MTTPDSCCHDADNWRGSSTTTRRALITGGSGYLGFRLAAALAKHGIEVTLLDVAPPLHALPPEVHFFAGSVADAAAVDAAFICSRPNGSELPVRPLDAVFHVASYGMSGRELRDRAKILSVNVGGTRNVIDACLRHGVPRLVYVSTCNVVFVGRPISGGDETMPYPPPTAYKDDYSATKAQAERLVREANGRPLGHHPPAESSDEAGTAGTSGRTTGGQTAGTSCGSAGSRRLHTCCIRSTGIWGPGEARHQPRVIRMVRAGLFQATFGDTASLSDWIHVDNLVQILILAERNLRIPDPSASEGPEQRRLAADDGVNGSGGSGCDASSCGGSGQTAPVAAAQVYFASDGEPINNFEHFKPFIVGLGYHYPSLNVPFALVYAVAWLIEYAWPLLSQLVADPPLTRMEVDKCCVEHWFRIDKARRELGYEPASYDRGEVVGHMAAQGWAASGARRSAEAELTVAGGGGGGGGGKARRLMGMETLTMWAVAVALVVVLLAASYGAGGSSLRLA